MVLPFLLGSSGHARTVPRKISRERRQAALLVGTKLTVAGERPAFFRGEV